MKKATLILILIVTTGVFAFLPSSQTVFEAAKNGNITALKTILAANPRFANDRGEGGRSPLQEAILARQSEAARFLVGAGADVNWRDDQGIVPLGYAAFAGDAALAGLLIERGAKIDAHDTAMGGTPLHQAALQGHSNVVRLLVEKGASLDVRTKSGMTPLAAAIERKHRECVQVLLSRGAAAAWRDEKGRTLLHRSVLARDPEIVRLLLAAGADPSFRSTYGNTPLDLAEQEGLTEISALLSASGKTAAREFPLVTGSYLGQPPPGLSPRMFAPGIVSTERDELNAVFTPDGREFYFTIRDASRRWTIMRMALEKTGWSRPRPASFSGRWSDVDLFITADGRRLYFCSNRPLSEPGETPKDFDIWMSERKADGWSKPVNLGAQVNSATDEFYPSLTREGTMYFQSRRTGGPGAPDIWRVRPVAGGWGSAECLPPPVNSPGFEGDTLVAPDESYLIVSTSRAPGAGPADLFLSMRGPNRTWKPFVRLESGISSPVSGENCQMLSPDGRYLFFTRDGDIYWVDAAVIQRGQARLLFTPK